MNVVHVHARRLARGTTRLLPDRLGGIVRRIDVIDHERTNAMGLNDRVVVGPGVVHHLCRQERIRPDSKRRSSCFIAALTHAGARPVALGALLALGATPAAVAASAGLPLESVATRENEIWEPERCPRCARGEPQQAP